MDADITTAIGYIVGLVVLFSFFHLGYIVNRIRDEAVFQTKLLILMSLPGGAAGAIGKTAKPYEGGRKARFMGRLWDCSSETKTLWRYNEVRIVSVNGVTLSVEPVGEPT